MQRYTDYDFLVVNDDVERAGREVQAIGWPRAVCKELPQRALSYKFWNLLEDNDLMASRESSTGKQVCICGGGGTQGAAIDARSVPLVVQSALAQVHSRRD